MQEVSKDEFKTIYFQYGKGKDGWTQDYWDQFYESPRREGMTYKVALPKHAEESRMWIVTDYASNEYRLFFMTEESEERFFDFPGND